MGSCTIRVRTQRGEIHREGQGNGPGVHRIDNVAAMELEQRPRLEWESEFSKENSP